MADGCPRVIHRDAWWWCRILTPSSHSSLAVLLSPFLRISDFPLEPVKTIKFFHLQCSSAVKTRRREDARSKWVHSSVFCVSCLGLGVGEKTAQGFSLLACGISEKWIKCQHFLSVELAARIQTLGCCGVSVEHAHLSPLQLLLWPLPLPCRCEPSNWQILLRYLSCLASVRVISDTHIMFSDEIK